MIATHLVRIGRNPMTDEIIVEPFYWIGDEGDVCSFCDSRADWQVGVGNVLYCGMCRVEEHIAGHAFWFDLGHASVEITVDDAGIHAQYNDQEKL